MLLQKLTECILHKHTNRMALTTENLCFVYDDALIEHLQTMDDEVFYREHDKEFDYYEQYLSNSVCSRFGSGMRYKKLKCSPSEQIRYAQKMAVKRVNAEKNKINDKYARNRRNARSAVLQETKEPVDDVVDVMVKEERFYHTHGGDDYATLFCSSENDITDAYAAYRYNIYKNI